MSSPKGTVVFSTVQRPDYGFDVYSIKLNPEFDTSKLTVSDETLLTDGISINFNAQFSPSHNNNDSIVFISERTGYPAIFLSGPQHSKPQQLPSPPESLFHDRPVVKNNRLYYISAHEYPGQLFKSWTALYSTDLGDKNITRLTPPGVVDFSPAISHSGKYIAVASYGSRPWGGDFLTLHTDIVVFKESDPNKRVVLCEKGGWPSWSGDSTVFFHHQADDGYWSIFQVKFPADTDDFSGFPTAPVRVTPPCVHCFTPAAMHDGKRIVVATRRRNSKFRHIEMFDLESQTFSPVTESLNPSFNHYNPFVSQDSLSIGYHRFKGKSAHGETTIRNFEPIKSPIRDLTLKRLNGSFPSFSSTGDLIAYVPDFNESNRGVKIVKSNGSKRWTLIKDRIAFYTSWSPTDNNVIFATLGPFFAPVEATVQIARITFNPSDLKSDRNEIPIEVKMLTREDTGNNAFSSCSPDGKSIVFRSGRNGHKNLYITDAVNGEHDGNIRQLTDGPWTDTMPSWSPKGDLIAFSSNRHKTDSPVPFSIYVVRPDGSDLKRIQLEGSEWLSEADKDKLERINHVCFSKDGEWLLFTANLACVTADPVSVPHNFQPYGDLFICRLDGSGVRRLTWNGYENGTPAWHPGNEVELLSLSLEEADEDELTGKFDDPFWIRYDPSDEKDCCM
ncbi:uncharacterized protein LOC126686474 [Mercurialis annua]|uniref:uncharacterized protein LOC126686474 n=1 Tax=Mercurialis annua TaxID=3986 RepID=UPI002160B667|nr:uncharacterized protein LOC126686474 [Mercurialis annua]